MRSVYWMKCSPVRPCFDSVSTHSVFVYRSRAGYCIQVLWSVRHRSVSPLLDCSSTLPRLWLSEIIPSNVTTIHIVVMSKPITMMHTAGRLLSSIAYMYTCSIIVLATLPKTWERIPLKLNNCVSMPLWLMIESILTYRQCQNQKHEDVHQEITNYP